MAAIGLLGAGGAAGLGAWLLLGGGGGGDALGKARSARARRALVFWLERLGSGALLAALGGTGWARSASRVLAGDAARTLGASVGASAGRALLALSLAAATLAGLALAGPAGAAVCPVGLACLVAARAARLERARAEELARQVPDAFRTLAGALGSGRSLSQAIAYVGGHAGGALGGEFGRAALRVSCGASAVEALEELAARAHAPGIGLMVTALVVSSRTGAPLQEMFLRSASLVERRFELERELRSRTAQVRLSARIVCALPAGMAGLLVLLSPDYREGLAGPGGAACLAVAACLDVAALAIIRRLMRGVM